MRETEAPRRPPINGHRVQSEKVHEDVLASGAPKNSRRSWDTCPMTATSAMRLAPKPVSVEHAVLLTELSTRCIQVPWNQCPKPKFDGEMLVLDRYTEGRKLSSPARLFSADTDREFSRLHKVMARASLAGRRFTISLGFKTVVILRVTFLPTTNSGSRWLAAIFCPRCLIRTIHSSMRNAERPNCLGAPNSLAPTACALIPVRRQFLSSQYAAWKECWFAGEQRR
jgi:hypothetical protein